MFSPAKPEKQRANPLNGCHQWVREGTRFPHTPHSGGVCCFFRLRRKKQHTPRQSCGTRLRAFFAVRNQHTKQVKPGEGKPLWLPGFFFAECPATPQTHAYAHNP
jgi:hypothetical protein